MKKVLSVLLAVLLLVSMFAFASCGKNNEETQNAESTAGAETESVTKDPSKMPVIPELTLTSDMTEAAAGEAVTVYFHIKNAVNLASITAAVKYDDVALAYVDSEPLNFTSGLSISNNVDTSVVFMGCVESAIDFADEVLMTATFKVSDRAVSGSETQLTLNVSELSICDDATGDTWARYEQYVEPVTLTIKIK